MFTFAGVQTWSTNLATAGLFVRMVEDVTPKLIKHS